MSRRNDTLNTHGQRGNNDTIHVHRSRSSKSSSAFRTPKLPLAALTTSPSSSGSMEDISLTSPSVGESEQHVAPQTPKRTPAPYVPEPVLRSPFRRLLPKPEPPKGSENDPILLEEYSPRHKAPILPDRPSQPQIRYTWQKIKRQKVNKPPSTRRPLAPKPTNSGTFTGDTSKDMHRMMHAKAAVTNWVPPVPQMPNALRVPTKPQMPNALQIPPRPQSTIDYDESLEILNRNLAEFRAKYGFPDPVQNATPSDLPFEVQYPGAAEFLARFRASNAPDPARQNRKVTNISFASEPEDMLRKRACEHIRHEMRADPEYPTPSDVIHSLVHPIDLIDPLVSQANLLLSLLQAYPESVDQQGLREDIGRLVGVQKRGVEKWMETEEEKVKRVGFTSLQQVYGPGGLLGEQRKGVGQIERMFGRRNEQRKRDEGLLVGQNVQKKSFEEIVREIKARDAEQKKGDEEARPLLAKRDAQKKGLRSNGFLAKMDKDKQRKRDEQQKKDEEVRGLLSAEAGIWGKGGEGVVDVFAQGGTEGTKEVAKEKDGEERGVKRKMGVCGWEMVE